MKIFEKLKTDRRFLLIAVILVVLTLVIPYITIPGVILTWFLWWFYKKSKFSKKFKIIATSCVLGLFILSITWVSILYAEDAEPHLTVTEPAVTSTVKASQLMIKGTYSPADRTIEVNGQTIPAKNGSFQTVYQLKIGENKIDVQAGQWKWTHVYLTATRELTDAEKAALAKAKATPSPSPTQSSTPSPTAKASTTPAYTTPKPISTPQPNQSAVIVNSLWTALDKSMATRDGYTITYYDTGRVILTRSPKEYFNDTDMVNSGVATFVKYGKEAFKVNGVTSIDIALNGSFTDQYGKNSTGIFFEIVMDKDTFDKYDWNSLKDQPIYDTLNNNTSYFFIDPSILKSLDTNSVVYDDNYPIK